MRYYPRCHYYAWSSVIVVGIDKILPIQMDRSLAGQATSTPKIIKSNTLINTVTMVIILRTP